MSFRSKKILVTGADGFIGSHLVEELLSEGYSVRPFVLYNSFNSWGWLDSLSRPVKKGLDVFAGDIRDPHGVRQAMKGCSGVLHLAALIGIPYSYHSPDTYIDTNIKGTLNVLQAARELGVSRVVHTSTSEVYGSAQFVPMTEEHPLNAQSPYAASKVGADQLALSFYRSFGVPVTVLRPFNTFGPRQSARAVIPTIITQLAAGHSAVQLGSLHPTRDFTYVKDTARAFVRTLEASGTEGQVIQVGSGHEISIGELAKTIARLMGKKIRLKEDAQRLRPTLSEVDRLCADTSKARKLLKWAPARSGRDGFEKGLLSTIQWFTQSKNLALYKADRCNI